MLFNTFILNSRMNGIINFIINKNEYFLIMPANWKMIIIKGKINWQYMLIAVIFSAICAGFLFMQNKWLSKDLAAPEYSLIKKPAPLPTEIDQNFLTQVNECLIPAASVYGYDLRVSSGYRTVAEQDQLYNQGRTVDGHIVTEAPGGKSIHNFGFAVDVADRAHGYDINWDAIGKIAAFCGLEPGDDNDLSHFEHRNGLATADFISGRRPPPLTLPCPIMDERARVNQALTLKDLQNCGAPDFLT
jgi:hypothetical protein